MNSDYGPDYVAYVALLRDLHRQIAAGRGEGAQADALRDAMDLHWERMSAAEVARAGELSEAFYRLSEALPRRPPLSARRDNIRRRHSVPRERAA